MTDYVEWNRAIERNRGRRELLSNVIEWVRGGGTVHTPYLLSLLNDMEIELDKLTEQGKKLQQQSNK